MMKLTNCLSPSNHTMATMMRYALLLVLLLAASRSAPCCTGFSAGRSLIARPTISRSFFASRISVEDNNIGETIQSTALPQGSTQRSVARIEKFARLPVWPVWQGVFLFFASRIFGEEVAAQWENR